MARARLPDLRAPGARLRGRVLELRGDLTIRSLDATDLGWAEELLRERVGGRLQARRGEMMDVLEGGAGAGLVASIGGARAGLVTWMVVPDSESAEVRALAVDPALRGRGIGAALLERACDALRAGGVARAWLVTTNDNLAALALYQKAGWRLATLRAGAVDDARRSLKPSIPDVGQHRIPIHDELELEVQLEPKRGDAPASGIP